METTDYNVLNEYCKSCSYKQMINSHYNRCDLIYLFCKLKRNNLAIELASIKKNRKNIRSWGIRASCEVGNNKMINFFLKERNFLPSHAFYGICQGTLRGTLSFSQQEIIVDHLYLYYNTDDPNFTPNNMLYYACLSGNMNIVDKILNKGATNFEAGLEGACFGNHSAIINKMKSLGAKDLNRELYGASAGGHVDHVMNIIRKGATRFNFAMRGACNCKKIHTAKILIEHGSTVIEPFLTKRNTQLLLLENGLSRDKIKYLPHTQELFDLLDQEKSHIKDKIDGLLIRDLEDIILQYVCF